MTRLLAGRDFSLYGNLLLLSGGDRSRAIATAKILQNCDRSP
ncbi:hypothetical protein [Coleofasciculus sp. FACHB-1120]|nr:hypothetical protein [Coleofasciculus sp. FACHB-1120]